MNARTEQLTLDFPEHLEAVSETATSTTRDWLTDNRLVKWSLENGCFEAVMIHFQRRGQRKLVYGLVVLIGGVLAKSVMG